jgi:23S rRNA pseudouridine1911/1915/1917 synthase
MTRELTAEPGRLDAVVAGLLGIPRADVQRAIAGGAVLVDGRPRPKSFRLTGGERLSVDLRAEPPEPEGPPVPVRYQDEHLAVVAKPAGVATHPAAGRRGGTLVDRLLGMGLPLARGGGPLRPGIVHRLDAGTSGLLVVAKTDEAHAALQALFRAHAVDRRYLALVRGAVANDAFSVEAPLGRRAARIVVDATEGRRAETRFEVRERFPAATLVEAAPRTGRTHQIRVHLASIGHPILGDRAYGGAGEDARAVGLGRPFLHARRIRFDHPLTGEPIEVEEPLPNDLADALRVMRAAADERSSAGSDAGPRARLDGRRGPT